MFHLNLFVSYYLIIKQPFLFLALSGMVFNVSIGMSDLENNSAKEDEGKKYALFIGDTAIVNEVCAICMS